MADLQSSPAPKLIEKIPSALLIAAATATSYALAHSYESAYLGFFGFPGTLARVSTNNAIFAAGAVLSVMMAALTAAAYVAGWLSWWRTLATDVVVFVAVALFRGVVGLILNRDDWTAWASQLGSAAALLVIVFVVERLITRWQLKKAARAASSGEPASSAPAASPVPPAATQAAEPPLPWSIANPAVARVLIPWVGREGIILIFVVILAHGVAADAGRAAARDGTTFFTVNRERDYVVIRTYDDLLLAASLDRVNHVVGRELILIPVTKEPGTALRLEETGKLRPETTHGGATPSTPVTTIDVTTLHEPPAWSCLPCHGG